MPSKDKGTHLTLENRKIIQAGIEHGATKTSIADTIGKDNSTVGKEIQQHRIQKNKCSLPLECAVYQHCKLGRNCTIACPKYEPFQCKRRDRSPGACNGCDRYPKCHFDKFCYDPSLTKKSRNALDSNSEKQKIQGVFEGEGRKTGLTIWTTVMPYVDKFIFALSCKISLILKHFLGIAIPKESRISARSGSSVSQKL